MIDDIATRRACYVVSVISFELVQHDIWPLEDGHRAVVRALQDGIEPTKIYDHLRGKNARF